MRFIMKKAIAYAHQKGGVGKTTGAIITALALKKKGYNVVVIDLEERQKSASIFFYDTDIKVITPTSSNELIEVIEKIDAEVIIIDCGGVDSDINRIAVAAADLVITPVLPNMFENAGLIIFENTIKEIEKEINSEITPYIMLTRFHPNAKSKVDKAIEEISSNTNKFKFFNTVFRYRTMYQDLLETGKLPKHEEIENFTTEVIRCLEI